MFNRLLRWWMFRRYPRLRPLLSHLCALDTRRPRLVANEAKYWAPEWKARAWEVLYDEQYPWY